MTVVDFQHARRRRAVRQQPRNANGEFHNGRSLQEKLRIVRAVAEAAVQAYPKKCPDARRVPQVYWDVARASLEARFGRIPAANEMTRQIRSELRDPQLSWRGVLALAHEADWRLAHLLKKPPDDFPTAPDSATIAFALALVAREGGKRTLSPLEYGADRDALLRQRRRTPSGDAYLRRTLPTTDSILRAMPWHHALHLAGLEQLEELERSVTGLPVPDAIAFHYAQTGTLPTGRKELDRFAGNHDFALQSMRGRSWPDWLALGRERIAEFPELPPLQA